MDNEEARAILDAELAEFEQHSYDEPVSLIGEPKVTKTIEGRAGGQYQVETRVVWDAQEGGDVRVLGAVDDGGWRAFLPLASSILKVPRSAMPAFFLSSLSLLSSCHPAFLPCHDR